ncbi:winged helix-turn-helix domain-containing protein [Streptomyces sp. NPDC048436]|uniref:winged helix-turn-helix domain-containing protein n=1 Tax=Streptomyces sp. NPDC048436 TaxID=3365550 RepID=UPI003714681A
MTADQRRELRELPARRDLTRSTRQRAECIRLLDRGETAPEVADLLECNVVTVRAAAHRSHGGGVKTLPDAPRPTRPARGLGDDYRAALARLLDASAAGGITWTVPALRDCLREQRGAEISADWLWELLCRDGFRWKRARDTVRHQADPVLQQAARARLEDLRTCGLTDGGARGRARPDLPGRVRLRPDHAHRLPCSRIGQRAVVPREDTKNRRVNVLGAQIVGTTPDLLWQPTSGKIDAGMLPEFVCADLAGLPGGAAALELAANGLDGQLPLWACSRPFTVVQRAQTSTDAIGKAVDQAMNHQRDRIRQSATNLIQAA